VYNAAAIAIGAANNIAIIVTFKLPIKSEINPNLGLFDIGCQISPIIFESVPSSDICSFFVTVSSVGNKFNEIDSSPYVSYSSTFSIVAFFSC